MNVTKYDLDRLEKTAAVTVTLSAGSNMRLVTQTDLNYYRDGRRHHCCGGLARTTPFRVVVASTDHWHLRVDRAGPRATGRRSSVSVGFPRSALPLVTERTERGLKVWLDKGEIPTGDSLRRKIDLGLAHST